jgi:hypothetical protein
MPLDLTDANSWAIVSVPAGTDPAITTNMQTAYQLLANRTRWLLGRRLLTWLNDTDLTSVVQTGVIESVCFDASTGVFTLGDANGYTRYSLGGLIWDDEGGGTPTGPNPGAGNAVTDIDSDDNGRRIACADSGTNDEVYYSTALGTWTICTITGTPGLVFETVGSDKGVAGVWLISDTAGIVYRSTDGITFSVVTVTGLTTQVRTILHTGDNSNVWLLMTDSQCARSTDGGLTWTTVSHGLSSTNQRNALAYDPVLQRFIVLISGGRNIGYSDDNGANWTEVTNALPEAITGAPRRMAAGAYGEMVAKCGNDHVFVTVDGGATWTRAYAPTAPHSIYTEVGYGAGLFLLADHVNIQRSLR